MNSSEFMITINDETWPLFALGIFIGLMVGLLIVGFLRAGWKTRLTAVETQLKNQEQLDQDRDAMIAIAGERLSRTFDESASAQFQSHTATFLRLAKENLGAHHEKAKGDLKAREVAIESLLQPIRETMRRTEEQLQTLGKSHQESHGNITAQLEAMTTAQQLLSTETRNLVNALRRPEVRGQWGELTLKRLVELAGMTEHCDFVTQTHTPTESGAVRPDMVVNLPEGRQLVVDVKTPLDAYLEATEAADDASRRSALLRHSSVVASRIRELAAKAYWNQFDNTPEFVILFIPGDQFLAAALGEDPNLLDKALQQNIILATPTSFVALLKAVAYGWQQIALTENATVIRGLAIDLYDRLVTFTSHMGAAGKSLSDAVKFYNRSVGSMERMVLPGARRFTELGIQPKKEMPVTSPIEEQPRQPEEPPDNSTQDRPAL